MSAHTNTDAGKKQMNADYAAGTTVKVRLRFPVEKWEAATVAPITADMLPIPAGWLPVRFAADLALSLIHVSRMVAAPAPSSSTPPSGLGMKRGGSL